MSSNDFFGRPLSRGMEDLEFELCEVCERKSPRWLEIQYQDDQPIVRFTCNGCHNEYVESRTNWSEEVARQIDDEEELPESTRPGWVDEFIQEQNETGTIESIETVDQTKEVEDKEEEDRTFSKPPESFEHAESEPELEEDYTQQQIANWAPKFIQEALFGPNPEGWLQENGGYEENQLNITLRTLGSFGDHNVNSVKLSAIQCLLGLYNRYNNYKDKVLDHLQRYKLDQDETVADFAEQSISQIQ